jgi:hypothetical protein
LTGDTCTARNRKFVNADGLERDRKNRDEARGIRPLESKEHRPGRSFLRFNLLRAGRCLGCGYACERSTLCDLENEPFTVHARDDPGTQKRSAQHARWAERTAKVFGRSGGKNFGPRGWVATLAGAVDGGGLSGKTHRLEQHVIVVHDQLRWDFVA